MKQAFVIQILVDPILKDAANQMRYGRLGLFFFANTGKRFVDADGSGRGGSGAIARGGFK